MFRGVFSCSYFFLAHEKMAFGKIASMPNATQKPKRKTAADKAIRRLFVAVDKAILAVDEARKARDEIIALSRRAEGAPDAE